MCSIYYAIGDQWRDYRHRLSVITRIGRLYEEA